MIHPDIHISPEAVVRLDAASVQTRAIAEVLGQFVAQLLDVGFTQEGAEHLADTLMITLISDG